jgi:hypothetical protein
MERRRARSSPATKLDEQTVRARLPDARTDHIAAGAFTRAEARHQRPHPRRTQRRTERTLGERVRTSPLR